MKVKIFYGSSKNLEKLNESIQKWMDNLELQNYKFYSKDVFYRETQENFNTAINTMITIWMVK